MNRQDKIAVYDSGVGGISVLRELRKMMPQEHYYYYGDSANAPYGQKSTAEVKKLALKAVKFIIEKQHPKCLVVACNTATAAAIEDLRRLYPSIPIIGIEPAFKVAADRFPYGKIGIMATDVTLREEKLEKLVDRYHHHCTVIPLPSPGIVELVEAGKANSPEAFELISKELAPYVGKLDALVLGCTHYPFVSDSIRQILGPDVPLIDGGGGTAKEAHRRLKELDLLNQIGSGSLMIENSSASEALLCLSRTMAEKESLGV